MTTNNLRPELEDLDTPPVILRLPRYRGYPVPWFVATVDGIPDFRIIKPGAIDTAVREQRCWICGRAMFGQRAYLIGPMCAVNRISAEPPSHVRCATYAARACPFLARPHARRRDVAPELGTVAPAGEMIRRNPGVVLVWVTGATTVALQSRDGTLFDIGTPLRTYWISEGRPATRAEILESINGGLPLLRDVAEEEGPEALAALEAMTERAMHLLPA